MGDAALREEWHLPVLHTPVQRSVAGPIIFQLAVKRGNLSQFDTAIVEAILDFAYSPALDFRLLSLRRTVFPRDPDYDEMLESRERHRRVFTDAMRAIIASLKRAGSSLLPGGLYLELTGVNRLLPNNASGVEVSHASQPSRLLTFERASIETFDRHFLIEDTLGKMENTWNFTKVQFWCVAWQKNKYTSRGLRGGPHTLFRARVVLCKVVRKGCEPIADYKAPSAAYEFQLLLCDESEVWLIGFDPCAALAGACQAEFPRTCGLRRDGDLQFLEVREPI